nr:sulfotransferase [Cellulomonas sp. APG4]
MPPRELAALVAEADVVVTHGGPGTMADARAAGHLPVLVPRDPALGEHVDGHQQRFATWAERKGLTVVARDADAFRRALTAAPARGAASEDGRVATTTARVAAVVDELLGDGAAPTTGPVLYVAGSGRSGSTLLERVLGQVPGVATLGEVHHLWERGVRKDELCGCGEAFSRCPFWSEVGRRAFGGWDPAAADVVARDADAVDRHRRVPANLLARRRRRAAVLRYTEHYRAIYAAARDVAGARLVVDSGKHPTLALCLAQDPRIDLRVLHLVRDPIGVAYSWSKQVERPEAREAEDALMTRYSPALSSALWGLTTLEAELLRTTRVPVVRMRYEDFVAHPRERLEEAWAGLGLDPLGLERVATTMHLEPNHTVAGNPMRFRTGEVALRPDTEWKQRMPRGDRWAVAALTLPLRTSLGYRDV